ncbi:unnamed protein product [Ixodes persulcatus]
MATKYNIGDPVWAKMKGFSPWPGKVANPTKDVKRPALKKPMQCIFFFGTNNYAWIQEDQIQPYEGKKDQLSKSSKTASFKEAVEAIEDYVKTMPELPVRSTPAEEEPEELPAPSSPPPVIVKTPKTPKDRSTEDKEKEPKRRKQDQAHRLSKRTSSESSSTGSASAKSAKSAKRAKHAKVAADKGPPATPSTPNNTSGSIANSTAHISSPNATSPSPSKSPSNLLRQSYVSRPVTPPLDVERISDVLKQKRVSPSNLKFGFLGLGNMGQGMVKNLINSGHHITVWNRTPSKCRDFVKAGATKGLTPADVVAASDVTFCCVSNSHAAKEMVFGNCGVLQEIRNNKGYVEMTSIDPDTSQDISEAILLRGGRYLEAPVSGSKKPAEDGTLIILAAGERSLFNDCASCFEAIGRHAFYLGFSSTPKSMATRNTTHLQSTSERGSEKTFPGQDSRGQGKARHGMGQKANTAPQVAQASQSNLDARRRPPSQTRRKGGGANPQSQYFPGFEAHDWSLRLFDLIGRNQSFCLFTLSLALFCVRREKGSSALPRLENCVVIWFAFVLFYPVLAQLA